MGTRRDAGWNNLSARWLSPIVGVVVAAAAIGITALAPTSEAADEVARTVVIAGVSGLVWDDVEPATTPVLWDLAKRSAVGSLIVRGVFQRTCSADGWLTLGTGARTVAPRIDLPDGGRRCLPMPLPREEANFWTVPGWNAMQEENANRYDPTFGLVNESVASDGGCVTAVGPGAALMLADDQGRIKRYSPDLKAVDGQLLAQCSVTAIDLGEIPPGPEVEVDPDATSGSPSTATDRATALQQLDAAVGQIIDALPPGATFVLTSTADETAVARLRVLTAIGPGPGETTYSSGLMVTRSTRHPGLVTITDVTDLVLASLGVTPVAPIVGSAPTVDPWAGDVDALIDRLIELDERAQVIVRITFPINQAFILVLLVMYWAFAVVGVVSSRRRRREGVAPTTSTGYQRALATASLVLASVPVATYLANVVPWWRLAAGPATGRATTVMLLTSVLLALALAATAVWLPWARQVFRSVAVVAGVTLVSLAADVMTGSHLQFASALGLSPIAAGRFYGLGNVAFSVFAACAVFVAVAMSAPLVVAGRHLRASVVVFGFGCVVALVDGWPTFGADFGGMIALIVGFGVFALQISPRGLSVRRVLLVLLAGLTFAALISIADYLRPEDARTHLGDFVASLVSGDSSSTVSRKLTASLSSFTFSAAAPFIPVVYAIFAWVVVRPSRFKASALLESYHATPTLRAGLISGLVIAGLGALLNDSGVIVTATMLGVGLPLTVAAAADPRRKAPRPTTPDQKPEPTSRSTLS